MKKQLDELMARHVASFVAAVERHAKSWIAVIALLTVSFGVYAALNLGINSDNVRLIAEDLPSRRNHEAFAKLFPNLENALLVVIDAETPELARDAAVTLAERLAADRENFSDAYLPGGGTFFETHGLLYRDIDDLDVFADQIARLQPILAALEQDSSIASLSALVKQGLEQVRDGAGGSVEPAEWAAILDSVGKATVSVYTEFPLALSWEEMMIRGSAIEVVKRRVVIAHPVLDFGSPLAAKRPLASIRALARELDLTPERGVQVRITGNPALNYEEMIGIAWDIGVGSIFSFMMVILVLVRGLRSLKLVIAAVTTLLVGLVWTAAFAAAAVGHLSVISASFAVLFIGLGVDFTIHLGMNYADRLRRGRTHSDAMRIATEDVAGSMVLCTLTTMIGFYVFVPTDYLGVAELGLIAGTGMLIILFLSFSLLPALLGTWLQVDPERELGKALHFRSTWWRIFESHPRHVVAIALVSFVVGLALAQGVRFDSNVVKMRNPTTESVQAFNDLLAEAGTSSPWFIDSVAENLEAARVLAARMAELPVVSQTLTLADYVPADQDDKLAILADLAMLLETPGSPAGGAPVITSFDDQVAALRELHEVLGEPLLQERDSSLADSVRLLRSRLGEFLDRVDRDESPEAALATLDEVLLSGLPDQLARLRAAVETPAIRFEDLPHDIVERMLTSDGRARVQIFPAENLSDEASFARFVDGVQQIDPQATGVAVNLVGFARATKSSFRQALVSAVALVYLLLWILWRRLRPTLLVMTPLVLASVTTVAAMALLDIPFNFANVVVIPLLLGIGVDSGIHLVHRHDSPEPGDLMDSTTARAVFYSALTTSISFGTLALSSHRGIASLGVVLSIGMLLMVICNLIVLPAMLRRGPQA